MGLSNLDILSDILISAREDKGYSQRRLAQITGISNSEISKLEKGQRKNPNLKILKKLCDSLGVSYEDVLEALGYIKSEYSFTDNTHLLNKSEQDYIIDTLINTWNNGIDTDLDFSNKEQLRKVLFEENSETIQDNDPISKTLNLIKKNSTLLSEENHTEKLHELISWYINSIGGDS